MFVIVDRASRKNNVCTVWFLPCVNIFEIKKGWTKYSPLSIHMNGNRACRMGVMSSPATSACLSIQPRRHQSSVLLVFCESSGGRWIPLCNERPVMRKVCPCHDFPLLSHDVGYIVFLARAWSITFSQRDGQCTTGMVFPLRLLLIIHICINIHSSSSIAWQLPIRKYQWTFYYSLSRFRDFHYEYNIFITLIPLSATWYIYLETAPVFMCSLHWINHAL